MIRPCSHHHLVLQCSNGGSVTTKTLTKHGNSWALVIDKPILDLLNINSDTPLQVTTDGQSIYLAPSDPKLRKKFETTLRRIHRDTGGTFDHLLKRPRKN